MKMNKLFASVAATAIALSAIAPVTANAATNYKGEDVDLNKGNAEAQDANGSGKATANSWASVQVVDGTLSLDSVPDFNFNPAVAGSKATLKNNDNKSATLSDSVGNGRLQITDSRKDDGKGFNLTLQMGKMSGVGNADPSTAGFVLNLPEMESDGQNTVGNKTVTFQKKQISETDLSSANAASTVIDAPQNAGMGNFVFDFSNGKGISMAVPSGVDKGSYSAKLVWVLSPKATTPGA